MRTIDFMLLNHSEIKLILQQFYDEYKTPRTISIANDKSLQKVLKQLLTAFEKVEIPSLAKSPNALKYIQQLKGADAYVYEAKNKQDYLSFADAVQKRYHLPPGTGWKIQPFLVLRLCFLLKTYLAVRNNEFAVDTDKIQPSKLMIFIEKELAVCANALNTYHTYKRYQNDQSKLAEFLDRFINKLIDLFAQPEDFLEVCFPCGSVDHATFLIFFKYKDDVILRIDNASRVRPTSLLKSEFITIGRQDEQKYKPIYIAQIPITELSGSEVTQELKSYLLQACLVENDSEIENPLYDVYNIDSGNEEQKYQLPKLKIKSEMLSKDLAFSSYPEQGFGNCIVENFGIGYHYRSIPFNYFPQDKIHDYIFSALIKAEFKFIVHEYDKDEVWLIDRARQDDIEVKTNTIHFTKAMPCLTEPRVLHSRLRKQQQLMDYFFPSADSGISSKVAVCHGLSGNGKTNVALKYFESSSSRYLIRAWFNGGPKLDELYREFAQSAGIRTSNENFDSVKKAVKAWFNSKNDWLLIYDGVDLEQVQDYLPTGKGHIIITADSKSKEPEDWKNFHIDPFTLDKALELLKPWLKNETEAALTELIIELEYIPIAICHAAIYITENGNLPVETYLKLIKQSREILFKHELLDRKEKDARKQSIAQTWHVTINLQIEKRSPLSLWLFENCAYLYKDEI
ncbi:MAG: hypothetical protein JSR33_08670, partial [Proteobacteria bacterium]|nr:hypothetical protein [Pseudomonadota bacterium]